MGSAITGNPEVLAGTASLLGALGNGMDETNTTIQQLADQSTSAGVWTGDAANVFLGVIDGMKGDIGQAGEAFTSAAAALNQWSTTLAELQAQFNSLEQEREEILAQLPGLQRSIEADQQANRSASVHYEQAQASATTGIDPAPTAPTLIDLGPQLLQSDVMQQTVAQIAAQQASLEEQALAAGNQAAYAVDEAARLSPHYRQYHPAGWFSDVTGVFSDVSHFTEQFGIGLGSAVWETADGVYGLARHPTRLIALGKLAWRLDLIQMVVCPELGVLYALDHRQQMETSWEGLAKGVGDWKDLSDGNVGRWLGNVTGNIAMVVLSDGAVGAVKGGIEALRVGESLTEVVAATGGGAVAGMGASSVVTWAQRLAGDGPLGSGLPEDYGALAADLNSAPAGLSREDTEAWFQQNAAGSYGQGLEQLSVAAPRWADDFEGLNNLQNGMRDILNGATVPQLSVDYDSSRSMLQALSAAPSNAPALIKGTMVEGLSPHEILDALSGQKQFALTPTSFTADANVAGVYAHDPSLLDPSSPWMGQLRPPPINQTPVVFRIAPDSQALEPPADCRADLLPA